MTPFIMLTLIFRVTLPNPEGVEILCEHGKWVQPLEMNTS